jgi:hypothetical protein
LEEFSPTQLGRKLCPKVKNHKYNIYISCFNEISQETSLLSSMYHKNSKSITDYLRDVPRGNVLSMILCLWYHHHKAKTEI